MGMDCHAHQGESPAPPHPALPTAEAIAWTDFSGPERVPETDPLEVRPPVLRAACGAGSAINLLVGA